MNLLERLAWSIDTMSMSEKFVASLWVTALGMAIVFIGLAILFGSIKLMEKVMYKESDQKKNQVNPTVEAIETLEVADCVDETELVAIITAAVAASLNTSSSNIIVKNITRVGDNSPSWARTGRVEQINSRL